MEYFSLTYPIPETLSSNLCGILANMAVAPGVQFSIHGKTYIVRSCYQIDLTLFIRSGRVKISRGGWIIPTTSRIIEFLNKVGYPSQYLFIRSQFNDCQITKLEAHKTVYLVNFKETDPFTELWR